MMIQTQLECCNDRKETGITTTMEWREGECRKELR